MGRALMASGNNDGALSHHRESLEVGRRLAAGDPNNPEHQRLVSTSLIGIGDISIAQGDVNRAVAHYQESKDIRLRLATADSSNARNARDYVFALERLARVTESGVRWSEVVAAMEQMDRRGQLSASDRAHLVSLRMLAAQQRG